MEEFDSIKDAFYREKQIQGWSRKKKEALINGEYGKLPELSRPSSLRQAQGPRFDKITSPVPDEMDTELVEVSKPK